MYFTAAIILLLYFVLLILSRKEEPVDEEKGILRPFSKMAIWIYKRACIRKLPLFSSKQVEKDLQCLYPSERSEQRKTNYYVKKIALLLLILGSGTLMAVLVKYNSNQKTVLNKEGKIERGSFSEGEKEIELRTKSIHGKEESFRITVTPRQLSEEEIAVLFQTFYEALPQYILGKNRSLEQVVTDLVLEEEYENYPFSVEWESSNLSVLGSTGRVYTPEKPTEVMLTLRMIYGEIEREEAITVCVIPPILTEAEQENAELEEYLRQTELADREEEVWSLPKEWRGKEIVWQQKVEDFSLLLFGMGFLVCGLVYVLQDKDLHQQLEQRKKQMKQEYPDIVHKLRLYVGAGMTVRGAFQKIAGEYEEGKAAGKGTEMQPAYEEMLYVCRELHAGVSEGAAYEHFGKRTGLQEYIRLSTLLTQNLKKGNSTLLERLKEEAERAGEERLQSCKKLGEEAGTKLLLPMVLMLLIVMVMIMIPAFSAM